MSEAEAGDDAREAVEHLQAAALELIQAARVALDAAEKVVSRPDAFASLNGLAGTVALLLRASAPGRGTGGGDGSPPGDQGAASGPV